MSHAAEPSPATRTYVDSAELLSLLGTAGALGGVRSFSPALVASGLALSAEERLTGPRIRALEQATIDLAELVRNDASLGPDQALVAARAAINPLQQYLLRAAALDERDFADPVVVARIAGLPPRLDERFNSVLPELLAGNPRLRVAEIPAERLSPIRDPAPPRPAWRDRLRHSGWGSYVYRALMAVGARFPWRGPRGTIAVLRENELVKETALALALKGFKIAPLRTPTAPPARNPDADASLGERLAAHASRALAPLLAPAALGPVAAAYARATVEQIRAYEALLPAWRAVIARRERAGLRAVLSNFQTGPSLVALARALAERSLPLVVFQHGVTVEYNARTCRYWPLFETSVGDLAVVFNPEAARTMKRPGFAPAVAAGVPRDYVRGGGLATRKGAPPIWYISTCVYAGTLGLLAEGLSDHERCGIEMRLLNDVLARLPHRVFYKPYPSDRYLDPDPVLVRARQCPGLEVCEDRMDLRYIVSSARVLVTSRAWSTVSWCVASGKPVVYIDWPDQAELTDEARAAMAGALLYFDGRDPAVWDRLRTFLSQPVEAIEVEWSVRAARREAFIQRFLWTRTAGAGRAAAAEIGKLLGQRAGRRPASAMPAVAQEKSRLR
jgi:hypothetical protein